MDETKPTARTPCCIRHKRDQTTSRSRAVRLAEKLSDKFISEIFRQDNSGGLGPHRTPENNKDSELVTGLDSYNDTRVVRRWSERQGMLDAAPRIQPGHCSTWQQDLTGQ